MDRQMETFCKLKQTSDLSKMLCNKHMKIHKEKHDPLGIEEAEFVIDTQANMFA